MIAKYLFFLILFMVILIHALQPWSRPSAAAPFMSEGGHGIWPCICVCICVSIHQGVCPTNK